MTPEYQAQLLDRLRKGLGVEVVVERATPKHRGMPGRSDSTVTRKRVVIVPAPCYTGEHRTEVLVVCESEGAYFWDGQEPLNEFKLIQHGFGMGVAKVISQLLDELMQTASKEAHATPETAQLKAPRAET